MNAGADLTEQVRVRALGRQHHYFSYLIEVSAYPVPLPQREAYLELFGRLSQSLTAAHDAPPEVTLLLAQLHHENANVNLSKHGRAWVPDLGVAVWPHKPPPEVWTQEEFEGFVPGVIPRPPVSMVFRLNGAAPDRANVLPVMAGRGTLTHFWLRGSAKEFYQATGEYFRSVITDEVHLAFPFYFPLLDGGTVEAMPVDLVDRLLAPVKCYVRESVEDQGLVIVSSDDLEPMFRGMGWTMDSPNPLIR